MVVRCADEECQVLELQETHQAVLGPDGKPLELDWQFVERWPIKDGDQPGCVVAGVSIVSCCSRRMVCKRVRLECCQELPEEGSRRTTF